MKIDTNKYKVWTWEHPMMLHWIINPGLVFNELILGQRVAKIILVEKDKSKTLTDRSFIPCPNCETIHDGRIWSAQNKTAFKNWYGLYCPNCGGVIPCLRNFASALLLTLTFPVWGWFRKSFKQEWLNKQPQRFASVDVNKVAPELSKKRWVAIGLSWGLFMFIFTTFIMPWLRDEAITTTEILISIPIWTLGGLAFGYTMKKMMVKKVQKLDTSPPHS